MHTYKTYEWKQQNKILKNELGNVCYIQQENFKNYSEGTEKHKYAKWKQTHILEWEGSSLYRY